MMVWLVGAKGMLGHEVASALDDDGFDHVDTDIECDITNIDALGNFASGKNIGWIINCSAYTAVDKAETEEEIAYRINAIGVRNLATVATEVNARIIHISTDYVFDGMATAPYAEDHEVVAEGAYGRTKAAGERFLQQEAAQFFIIRTAWLYGIHGKNFVYTMLRLMNERDEVKVVGDQRGTPTYAPDLAHAIVEFVRNDPKAYGIYHFTNDGETTWHGFAAEIYRMGRELGRIGKECKVTPITTAEYPTPAKRPAYSVLSKEKIKSTLALAIPDWRDGLRRFFDASSALNERTTR